MRLAVDAMSTDGVGEPRAIAADQVEAAVLDRTRPQPRKFRRLSDDAVARALAGDRVTITERGVADPTATGSPGPDNSGAAAAPPA